MLKVNLNEFSYKIKESVLHKDGSLYLFSGLAGVGKDTLASFYQKKYPNDVRIIHFADSLKQMSLKLSEFIHYNVLEKDEKDIPTIEHFYDPDKKNKLFYINQNQKKKEECQEKEKDNEKHLWTPRKCMQWLGTDFVRFLDIDFWAKQLLKYIIDEETKYNKKFVWLIPDWRFNNEYTILNEHFDKDFRTVYTILIQRKNNIFSEQIHNHSSENTLNKNIDMTIELFETIEEMTDFFK